MQPITDIGTLIVQTPGICGGRPRIEGRRITVQNIAIDYNAGETPETIVEGRPHLSLAQVYVALACYFANKEMIDTQIAEERELYDRLVAGEELKSVLRDDETPMRAVVDIGTLITRHPGIHGGCPIVAGTGVTVRRIASDYKRGMGAEAIAQEIPHLTLAQIYAALAYYHANQEIEADLLAQAEEAERLEAESRVNQKGYK